jgi:hypothetical protein
VAGNARDPHYVTPHSTRLADATATYRLTRHDYLKETNLDEERNAKGSH